MPDKPFVINDRRKFTADGDLRPDVILETSKPAPPEDASAPGPHLVTTPAAEPEQTPAETHATTGPQAVPPAESASPTTTDNAAAEALPPLSVEQIDQATRAYDATTDRLDTAMRAADPGADHAPPMTFERVVQSLYMQAILQLGGGTEPGQQPRVDIIGARATTDMLAAIAEKTKGNLTPPEQQLMDSALFEMRMGFLEVTQLLARQAASRQAPAPGSPNPLKPNLVS